MDLTKIYKKYSGTWIVFDQGLKKVIAFSSNAKKAYDEALKKGYKKPVLFKVPKKNLPYIGPLFK